MWSRLKQRKGLIIGIAVVLTLVALALAPWALWHAMHERPMDVLVIDKTVAKPNYREHAGLFWLLRHEKVVQRETGKALVDDRDYAGRQFTPDGQATLVPIPNRPTDLVYITDTYGVYEDDLAERPLGLRSPLVEGGLSFEEVNTITRNLRPGATLVGEFNCLASPTVGAAREALSEAFGVTWTGWIGRHFTGLELGADMPLWIPRTWKRQTGERWQFRGPGYILVNEEGHLIVLVEGVDTPDAAVTLNVDGAAADHFGTSDRLTYDYWFEIMEPRPGAEVLATFELALTDSGREKMRGVPFDRPIPAILRTRRPGHLAYYFAGDFADSPARQKAYRYRWLPEIRALLGAENRDDLQAVYWRIYAPIMQRIIREAAALSRRRGDADA
jgi:hypothetical protein